MRLIPRVTAGLALATLLTGAALPVAFATAPVAAPLTATIGGDRLAVPGIQVQAKDGRSPAPIPPLTASSWVVADADTGEILASKNAHLQRRPASTLKTLTALTLIPRLDPDATYVPDYSDIAIEGSKVGIVNGSTYTNEQLFYGLFLASGNDTAQALSKSNGGVKPTVKQMNAEARRLQANDTVARTPSGLDADGQRSSAYDLALIARAGLAVPDFRKYASTVSVDFPREGSKAKRKSFKVYNHNPLVIGGYEGAIGVKTGYTVLAGRTFVGAAERDGRTLIVTLMNYGGTTYRTSAALLDWGFANAKKVEPIGQLVDPLPEQSEAAPASGEDAATTGGAAGAASTSGGLPLWPFALVGIPLLALGFAAATGRLPRRPRPAGAAGGGLEPVPAAAAAAVVADGGFVETERPVRTTARRSETDHTTNLTTTRSGSLPTSSNVRVRPNDGAARGRTSLDSADSTPEI
jgi:serine-type D-Ala-D-Ala carboxypeptidase (penicillin-binding protein 5/6)